MPIDHNKAPQYELVEMVEGAPTLVLHVNGTQAVCPFQPATPVEQDGKMLVGRSSCNTGCPLATILHSKDPKDPKDPKENGSADSHIPAPGEGVRHEFTIDCGGQRVTHEVTIRTMSRIRPASANGLFSI